MKATTTHQSALESALQQYLSTAQPLLRLQALEEVAEHLLNPGMLLAAPQLTSTHPLRREALILSDAFEAVTNGMQTAEVMEALQEIADDSLFQPWRHLVLAVHFFYEGLDEAALAHLQKIPSSGPLGPLKSALATFVSGSDHPPVSRSAAAQALYEQLHSPDPELRTLVQQLTDTLESAQEQNFWSTLADFLEDCCVHDESLGKRVTLWAWNQLAWQDFDEATLLDITIALWGKAEACRLAALGTFGWDPEGALLLWGRFLINGLREDVLLGAALKEAYNLALEFHQAVREVQVVQGIPSDWEEAWSALARTWSMEVALRRLSVPALPSRSVRSASSASSMPEKHLPPDAQAGQLDLFAS